MMKKTVGILAALLLLTVSVAGCAPEQSVPPTNDEAPATTGSAPSDSTTAGEEPSLPDTNTAEAEAATPDEGASDETVVQEVSVSEEPNFRLLISDEKNDIEDFSELWISVSGIGLVPGDEEGLIEETFDTVVNVNLRELTGDAAVETWTGYVESGEYVKIFLYVDEVWGVLVDAGEGEEPTIKLPSDKLQLKLPVRIDEAEEGEEQEPIDFVFDITVHSAGKSGQYILSPQASESGQGKTYRLVEQTAERLTKGKPDFTGPRTDTGKPDWAGQSEGRDGDEEDDQEDEEEA